MQAIWEYIPSIMCITSSVSSFLAPMLWFGSFCDLVVGPFITWMICWEIQTDEQNCDWIYWFNCYIFDLFHSYSWGPKTFKTNGLHRNPVMNVLLPLNLLIESPLLKLLAVTIALSLFFFFLFLPESASSSCFGGSRTKTNGFSDVTWSRSWLREWWLIANLTYRGCPITPEIWSMVILWIEYLKLNLGLKYYQDVT